MNVDEAIEEARKFGEQEPKDMLFAEHVAIELAAEVERLRDELAEKKAENSDWEECCDRLKAELAAAKAARVKFAMNDCNVFEAVTEGVDRAITRMITGITQMPSTDFWETLKTAIETAFERVANETIDRNQE